MQSKSAAFEIGHEGIIPVSWVVSDIAIGQKTQTMIEELLQETQPILLAQIDAISGTVRAYASNMMQIPIYTNGIVISLKLQEEIQECLGKDIFSKQEKLP